MNVALYRPPSPLRLARLRRGLSLDAVSSAIGVDRGQLSRIERGLAPLRPDLARRLSGLYGEHVPPTAERQGREAA